MNLEQQLKKELAQIEEVDRAYMVQTEQQWDRLCKPLKSLGKLEEIVIQLSGITRSHSPKSNKKAVIIMAGDNGVVEEGVTQTGQEVTRTVVENMTKGNSAVCVMANINHADVIPVDIGIATDPVGDTIVRKKVRYGTGNIRKEQAMTREEGIQAILSGIEVVKELVANGYDTFVVGEMGIGNTTTSSALCTAYFEESVEAMTGKGAGLSAKGVQKKQQVIQEAIQLHKPDRNDPLDLVCKIGGLDIAGMIGCYLGGAIYQKPMIMDGLISSVSAMLAIALEPKVKGYLLPSHCSKEPAGKRILEEIGFEPYLQMDMCMGEGTGAVCVFSLIDYALACYKEIPGFEENHVKAYVPLT